jgi:hypothetical protein
MRTFCPLTVDPVLDQRTLAQRGLDDVLTTESLPTTTPPPAAEQRVLGLLGLGTLQSQLQAAVRTVSPVSSAERNRKGPGGKIVPEAASGRKARSPTRSARMLTAS